MDKKVDLHTQKDANDKSSQKSLDTNTALMVHRSTTSLTRPTWNPCGAQSTQASCPTEKKSIILMIYHQIPFSCHSCLALVFLSSKVFVPPPAPPPPLPSPSLPGSAEQERDCCCGFHFRLISGSSAGANARKSSVALALFVCRFRLSDCACDQDANKQGWRCA